MAPLFLVLGLGLPVADCPIGPPLPMHMRVESTELAVVAQVEASWVAHEGPYPLSISQSHGVVITVLETVYGELPAERFELLYDGYQSCVGGGILAEGRTHLLLLRRWGEDQRWTLVGAEVDREGLTPELLRPRVEALRGCRMVDGLPDGTEEERRARGEAERRWLDSLLVQGLGWEWSIERWYADWRDRHHARQRTVRRFGRSPGGSASYSASTWACGTWRGASRNGRDSGPRRCGTASRMRRCRSACPRCSC